MILRRFRWYRKWIGGAWKRQPFTLSGWVPVVPTPPWSKRIVGKNFEVWP